MTIQQLLPSWFLKLLVRRNLRLRREHKLPDKWYWADLELLSRGYYNNG